MSGASKWHRSADCADRYQDGRKRKREKHPAKTTALRKLRHPMTVTNPSMVGMRRQDNELIYLQSDTFGTGESIA